MLPFLKLDVLWNESVVLEGTLLRRFNQHRREPHFHCARRLTKCVNQLRHHWRRSVDEKTRQFTTPDVPRCLWHASHLVIQARVAAERTFLGAWAQLNKGLFVPLNTFLVASASRIWYFTSFLLKAFCNLFISVKKQATHIAVGSSVPSCLKHWVCNQLVSSKLQAPFQHDVCEVCCATSSFLPAAGVEADASDAILPAPVNLVQEDTGEVQLPAHCNAEDMGVPISRSSSSMCPKAVIRAVPEASPQGRPAACEEVNATALRPSKKPRLSCSMYERKFLSGTLGRRHYRLRLGNVRARFLTSQKKRQKRAKRKA